MGVFAAVVAVYLILNCEHRLSTFFLCFLWLSLDAQDVKQRLHRHFSHSNLSQDNDKLYFGFFAVLESETKVKHITTATTSWCYHCYCCFLLFWLGKHRQSFSLFVYAKNERLMAFRQMFFTGFSSICLCALFKCVRACVCISVELCLLLLLLLSLLMFLPE